MCTAINFINRDHYFGRNLDLEFHYNEAVTITPRNYPFAFRHVNQKSHYAMIGIGTVIDDYPLYYEATNEHGLSMAGLNFPGNAVYLPYVENKDNVTPFEFVPWILSQCKDLPQAKKLLRKINLLSEAFSDALPLSPLHWIISDASGSVVAEPNEAGVRIYENQLGILTNSPPFPYHMHHIREFLNLTPYEPQSRFCDNYNLTPYSRGMGAIGLPGDSSSSSRFVRAAFHTLNSISDGTEDGNIAQFFHILDSVSMVNGSVRLMDNPEKTVYSCCCNTSKGIYYYTTYENRRICAVDLFREDLNGSKIIQYPLEKNQCVHYQN